ncbi:hypothetical protein [Streptococcus sp. sy004]|uniref:hypothetical protein n=1 Tax=Streptococcus sp. sy004 TaxID=2600149 RepID=UPI0011B739FB|nr:hypothetical protein [Streptococcus sp. sy004]TWT12157.1 hypothetical protein FRX54_01105 [Streptococcus sp. sy004]
MFNATIIFFILLIVYITLRIGKYKLKKMGNSPINTLIDRIYNEWYNEYYWLNDKQLDAEQIKNIIQKLGQKLLEKKITRSDLEKYFEILEQSKKSKDKYFNIFISILNVSIFTTMLSNILKWFYEGIKKNNEIIQIYTKLVGIIVVAIVIIAIVCFYIEIMSFFNKRSQKVAQKYWVIEMLILNFSMYSYTKHDVEVPSIPKSKIDNYFNSNLHMIVFVLDIIDKLLSKFGKISQCIKKFIKKIGDFIIKISFERIIFMLFILCICKFPEWKILIMPTFGLLNLTLYLSTFLNLSKKIKIDNKFIIKYTCSNFFYDVIIFLTIIIVYAYISNAIRILFPYCIILIICEFLLFKYWEQYMKTDMSKYLKNEIKRICEETDNN